MGMPGEKYTGGLHGRPAKPEQEVLVYLPEGGNGKGLFIEFRGGDSPTLTRSAWLKMIEARGYKVRRCKTLGELTDFIQQARNPS
jgi:hypothetical protein